MNITISKNYIQKTISNVYMSRLLTLFKINDAILWYVLPWMGSIASVANVIVLFFCMVIYMKTKKKNHKPAFVFIGFLASMDSLLGWYENNCYNFIYYIENTISGFYLLLSLYIG